MDPLHALTEQIRQFALERDWDRFHSPKNLSMALIAEAAELLEHFQWATEEQSYALAPEKLQAVKHEIGDVFIYLIRLCDRLHLESPPQPHPNIGGRVVRIIVSWDREN